jgi:Skp1 family, tetramerisation domain
MIQSDGMTAKIVPSDPVLDGSNEVSNSVLDTNTDATAAVTVNDDAGHDEAKVITLISCDEVHFSISLAAAKGAGLLVDTLGCEDDDDDDPPHSRKEYEPITIPRVDAECLEKVIEFLQHHAEDPLPRIQQPLVGNSVEEVCVSLEMLHGMSFLLYNRLTFALEFRW